MTPSHFNEAETRTELIDTQLVRAGCFRNRRTLLEEFLLKTSEPDNAYRIQQDDLRRIAKKKIQSQQGAVSQVEIQSHHAR